MPRGLKRFQNSRQSHFITFTCFHRQRGFDAAEARDLFAELVEIMRLRFAMRIYGYVVMPEHIHLLVSEPQQAVLADAIHFLKLSFSKRVHGANSVGAFWQKRYYDRNIRNQSEFERKLCYLHRNPVKRGLCDKPEDWKWSSFRHYAFREKGAVEIESEWAARERERLATGGGGRIFLIPG